MLIPTVAVIIIEENKVLLVKNGPGSNHLKNAIGLPSGHVEPGETAKQAAVRELAEESGFITTEAQLTEFPGNFYTARIPLKDGSNKEYSWQVFLCQNYSGELKTTNETEPFWADLETIGGLKTLVNVPDVIFDARSFLAKKI